MANAADPAADAYPLRVAGLDCRERHQKTTYPRPPTFPHTPPHPSHWGLVASWAKEETGPGAEPLPISWSALRVRRLAAARQARRSKPPVGWTGRALQRVHHDTGRCWSHSMLEFRRPGRPVPLGGKRSTFTTPQPRAAGALRHAQVIGRSVVLQLPAVADTQTVHALVVTGEFAVGVVLVIDRDAVAFVESQSDLERHMEQHA
ncbi:MAG: hypothetical protein RLZ98_2521 [Pseudomonadota bacterium]